MTTEPKFIPNEAIEITIDDKLKLKTRLVDCVGYLIPNSIGAMEDNQPRMVKTPWSDDEMPFEKAAEIGTKKVIEEHSTIGILVTTDGSITEIPREDYVKAEERVVSELKAINKPFIILLNSEHPSDTQTINLANDLRNKYNVSVLPINCANLNLNDITNIFSKILYEFPVSQINFKFPSWVNGLDLEHELKIKLFTEIKDAFGDIELLKEVSPCINKITKTDIISGSNIDNIKLGNGNVNISITLNDDLFYNVLTEMTGVQIDNEGDLFSIIGELSKTKTKYDKISFALDEVNRKGYGIVTPSIDELILDEPEIVKQGSRFGVKLKATAPSLHIIKANIETEVSPIFGSEKQY